MAREFAEQFYNSKAWQRCRDSYKASVGGLCERCKAKGQLKPAEIVHHVTHITPNNINDPFVTLNPANLMALCRDCHAEVHKRVKKRYKVDANGRIVVKT